MIKTGIGQDSHRFEEESKGKPLMLGGVNIPSHLSLDGNSDADVILHAICNAISGISGQIIIGPHADKLLRERQITDSVVYVKDALKTLNNYEITHVSVSIECLAPQLIAHVEKMRARIAEILDIKINDVGITATTGEGLTEFGKGKGIQVFAVVTAMCKEAH